jgi:hypothetical protein
MTRPSSIRCCLVVAALLTPMLHAQAPVARPAQVIPSLGRLLGVFDDDGPVEGVEVVDLLTGTYATTSRDGAVSLAFLSMRGRVGGSPIRVRKLGYEPIDTIIPTGRSDTASITMIIRKATALPTVVTTGTLTTWRQQEFEAHKKAGNGTFFGAQELRLAESRGILSSQALVGRYTVRNTRGENCVTVFGHNGTPTGVPPDTMLVNYDAIEVYRHAQIPAAYNMTARPRTKVCTVIVYWDRER